MSEQADNFTEPDISELLGGADFTAEAVPDEELDFTLDDVEDLREMMQEAEGAGPAHEDVFPPIFPARLNADGTFQELLVVNGSLSDFTAGRCNDTTNKYIPLANYTGNAALIVEMLDSDPVTGNPVTGWLAIQGGTGSTATGGSTLLFTKTTTADTLTSNGSFGTLSTAFGAVSGDVLRVRAAGDFYYPPGTITAKISLVVDGATLFAPISVFLTSGPMSTFSWIFDAELVFTQINSGANGCIYIGSARFHPTGAFVNIAFTNVYGIGIDTQATPFTQVHLLDGTAKAYLNLDISAGTLSLKSFNIERLRP